MSLRTSADPFATDAAELPARRRALPIRSRASVFQRKTNARKFRAGPRILWAGVLVYRTKQLKNGAISAFCRNPRHMPRSAPLISSSKHDRFLLSWLPMGSTDKPTASRGAGTFWRDR
jgi:hypothetical protein